MHAAKNKDAAALNRQRIDDRLHLAQRFAGVQLRFGIAFALQQFKVGDRFETDHLVTAGGVDHQVPGDGEQIGAAGGDVGPVFGGVGAGQNLCDHILQFVPGRQNAPQTAAQRRFMRQNDGFEPVQFCANPLHVDPHFIVSRASPETLCFCVCHISIMDSRGCPAHRGANLLQCRIVRSLISKNCG